MNLCLWFLCRQWWFSCCLFVLVMRSTLVSAAEVTGQKNCWWLIKDMITSLYCKYAACIQPAASFNLQHVLKIWLINNCSVTKALWPPHIFNIGMGCNPPSLILFASFTILPHTKVHQANASTINSSDFDLRQIKIAGECAFESHVRRKPLKSFYFCPIISNYLVYPLSSEQVPLLHSAVHIIFWREN